jgi:hypothetical protein
MGEAHNRKPAAERAEIDLRAGERPAATDEAIAILSRTGGLYERSGELVRIVGSQILPVDECWLTDYLARHIRFFRYKASEGDEPSRFETDPPAWLARIILAKPGERGLPDLTGIITAPTLRADGSLLDRPGFDAATGLYLQGGGWPEIPDQPSMESLCDAWVALWRPFAEFPYASLSDRGSALAAILTAIVRRSLPRAPAGLPSALRF